MQYKQRLVRKNRAVATRPCAKTEPEDITNKSANTRTQSWPYLAGQEGSTQAESKQTTGLEPEQKLAKPGLGYRLADWATKLGK